MSVVALQVAALQIVQPAVVGAGTVIPSERETAAAEFEHSVRLAAAGQFEEAEGLYKQTVGRDPTKADRWLRYGALAELSGNWTAALERCDRAALLVSGGSWAAATAQRARVLKYLGRLDESSQAFEQLGQQRRGLAWQEVEGAIRQHARYLEDDCQSGTTCVTALSSIEAQVRATLAVERTASAASKLAKQHAIRMRPPFAADFVRYASASGAFTSDEAHHIAASLRGEVCPGPAQHCAN